MSLLVFALWWDKVHGRISESSRSIGPRVRKNSSVAEMLFPRLEREKTCLGLLETQLVMLPVDLLLLLI